MTKSIDSRLIHQTIPLENIQSVLRVSVPPDPLIMRLQEGVRGCGCGSLMCPHCTGKGGPASCWTLGVPCVFQFGSFVKLRMSGTTLGMSLSHLLFQVRHPICSSPTEHPDLRPQCVLSTLDIWLPSALMVRHRSSEHMGVPPSVVKLPLACHY